ncbi:MAG: hypothetical protein PHP74_03140 [Candidatus Gracilibacteria bacterium]|nr:hypothetical protein [Candidatus Gracilibacteria bacterium]
MKNPNADPREEVSAEVKDSLNKEGFVHGDSRPESQPVALRVTPESESIINRVNHRVSELMTGDKGLTEDQAKEVAMKEIENEVESGTKRYPDMASYLRYMSDKYEYEIPLSSFWPEELEEVQKTFHKPGTFVDIGLFAGLPGSRCLVFLSKDQKLKVLPLPPKEKALIGLDPNNIRIMKETDIIYSYRRTLSEKLGFHDVTESGYDTARYMVVPRLESAYRNKQKEVTKKANDSFAF